MQLFPRQVINNARAIMLAVVIHVIAIGILLVNMQWDTNKPAVAQSAPIQAQTVDRKLIDDELQRLAQEKKQKAEAEVKRKAEEKRKKELAEKQREEAERKKAEEIKRKKLLAEKQAKALAAKKRREEQKRQAEKREAKKRKQQLAEAAEKKRIADEQERLAMQEKQRRQKEREASLLLALEQEEDAARLAQAQALIQNKIESVWEIPANVRQDMSCVMGIRLLPSGEVISVKIVKSSGDEIFDRNAKNAVHKASPLPVSISSVGSRLFNSTFREFNFNFDPDEL